MTKMRSKSNMVPLSGVGEAHLVRLSVSSGAEPADRFGVVVAGRNEVPLFYKPFSLLQRPSRGGRSFRHPDKTLL
jgi:hypothetical protein